MLTGKAICLGKIIIIFLMLKAKWLTLVGSKGLHNSVDNLNLEVVT